MEGFRHECAVIGKFQADVGQFRQALTDRADEFVKIAEGSKSAGAIHHRFGIGDGFVVLVDEWRAWSNSSSSSPTPNCRPSSPRSVPRRLRRRSPLARRHLTGPVLAPGLAG